MKCSIIKDLLPLYCDGIASEDSSHEIEEHLRDCNDCRKVYEAMSEKTEKIPVPDKDIKPLKKVKKRSRLKILLSVIVTAAVLVGAFVVFFRGVIPAKSEDVAYTVTVQKADEIIRTSKRTIGRLNFEFTVNADCSRETFDYSFQDDGKKAVGMVHEMWIYPEMKNPLDDRGEHPNQFSWSVDIQENNNQQLIIHYRDRNELINLNKLYEELINK